VVGVRQQRQAGGEEAEQPVADDGVGGGDAAVMGRSGEQAQADAAVMPSVYLFA